MPKGSVGGYHLGGSGAHNKREQLKHDKKAVKLATKLGAKARASQLRHAENFKALNEWIKETKPFCVLFIKELRKERPTIKDIVQAVAISRWYKKKVTKSLKGCKGHTLGKEELELVNERFEFPLVHSLMHASEFRGNKKLIEAEITKAVTKFNQEMNG